MVQNKALCFIAPPDEMPEKGKHIDILDVGFDNSKVPEGGAIAKVLYASLDPYFRGRMLPKHVKSYFAPFEPNAPIDSRLIAQVTNSDNEAFVPGDVILTFGPVQEYLALTSDMLGNVKTESAQKKPSTPRGTLVEKLSASNNIAIYEYLGALGMPGLTAYSSLYEIGKPKKGETIYISGAAGAVGALVGQLAKREGLHVIGSVGSDEKLEYIIKELGFHDGFNYKNESPADAVKRLAPEGLDIYYDNVGGETLQAAFDALRNNGRVVSCGMISQYNTPAEKRFKLSGLENIFGKCLKIQGFITAHPDFGPKYQDEHQKTVTRWMEEGSVKAKTHITQGIDKGVEALIEIFKGGNFGKAVLQIGTISTGL